jgi:hypothetical protein
LILSIKPIILRNVELFLLDVQTVLRLTPHPVKCVEGALSPEVKLSGREADHSPPTSAEGKNTCPYAFMA